jgi:hypothetical protein
MSAGCTEAVLNCGKSVEQALQAALSNFPLLESDNAAQHISVLVMSTLLGDMVKKGYVSPTDMLAALTQTSERLGKRHPARAILTLVKQEKKSEPR